MPKFMDFKLRFCADFKKSLSIGEIIINGRSEGSISIQYKIVVFSFNL